MRQWLNKATAAQKQKLAELAGTSVPHLQHIAGGRRKVEAQLAQKLAEASKALHTRTLLIDARALCATCARCPLVDKRKAPLERPEKPTAA
jgi:hypothetical protein